MSAFVRIAFAASLALVSTAAIAEPCRLDTMGVLKVSWEGRRALVDMRINGKPSRALIDTGSTSSVFFRDGAKALGLSLQPGLGTFTGLRGIVQGYSTHVKELIIGRWREVEKDYLAMGSDFGVENVALMLGQDVLSAGDVEFDLAHDAIKLFKPLGDCERAELAYWAPEFMVVDILRRTRESPFLRVAITLNGKDVVAVLDTGATYSIISRTAAARVGVEAGGPNTTPYVPSTGIANVSFKTWIGNFSSFILGGEAVQNARIRIGDFTSLGFPDGDMLLGMDFFRAHHIFVSYKQGKMYFTYNGGRIFDVTSPPESLSGAPAPDPAPQPGQ